MGLNGGSVSNNTGASSSSNYTAPSSSVVISSAEYTSINVGEWMTYTPTAPVGSSSTDVFTLMSEVGYTYPTKLAFFGMTLDKVLAVKNAIDNGATTVNVGPTPYTLKSILNFQDADGMKTVVNSSFGGYYWDSMFGGYVMSLYITDSYGTSNTTLSGSNVSIN